MDTRELDIALKSAFSFLVHLKDEAKYRLSDIIVEEVSLVDRAANKRRFLTVKRGGVMKDKNPVEEQATAQPEVTEENKVDDESTPTEKEEITLPGPVKEGMVRILTESIERLLSVANMVKDSKETTEEMEQPLPTALAGELKGIAELLASALSRYPSPESMNESAEEEKDEAVEVVEDQETEKMEGTVSAELREVSEIALSLAAAVASAEDLDTAAIESLRKLAMKLNSLAEKYPQPTAMVEEEKGEDPSPQETASEPVGEEKSEETTNEPDVMKLIDVAALEKLRDAIGNVISSIKENNNDDDAEKRAAETEPLVPKTGPGDMGNIGQGPESDQPLINDEQYSQADIVKSDNGEKVEEENKALKKTVEQLTDRVESLKREMEELAKTPHAPASRQEAPPARKEKAPVRGGKGRVW